MGWKFNWSERVETKFRAVPGACSPNHNSTFNENSARSIDWRMFLLSTLDVHFTSVFVFVFFFICNVVLYLFGCMRAYMCFCVGVFMFLVWHFIHEQASCRTKTKNKHQKQPQPKYWGHEGKKKITEKKKKHIMRCYCSQILFSVFCQMLLVIGVFFEYFTWQPNSKQNCISQY